MAVILSATRSRLAMTGWITEQFTQRPELSSVIPHFEQFTTIADSFEI
jgi:hypothetical protein